MDGAPEPVGRVEFPALGGLAVVLTTDPGALERAAEAVRDEVAAIDAACSRFRADSELSRVNAAAGTFVAVGPLFAEALDAALWAAEATAGDVDPTCGTALRELGYDMDFAQLPEVATLAADQGSVTGTADGAAGWRAVEWDRDRGRVRVPVGTALDFGATAKALAADRAAARAAWAAGCGVLVSLSGDL
ncbi:MAG: FAD:protein FMN transferase, partial [Catenulispora sp.]|nr:FAD:protein FMN transferase [Catenulispora sp.]